MVSSSFCRMLSSMKICCTFWSKGSTQNGFPPRMEKVLLAHLQKINSTKWAAKELKWLQKIRLEHQCVYQSKWSWNPPRPWTELKYWYRPRSPLRFDTRSSSRISTIPLLLQRIFPKAMFTFNWKMSKNRNWHPSHMWKPIEAFIKLAPYFLLTTYERIFIYLKARQRLNLLRWLRVFNLPHKMLPDFYTCTNESILCRGIIT